MALEVEDGTGKTNAESYVSVAEIDAYFANRNLDWNTLPASPDPTADKEAWLRRATDYIDARYGDLFKGERAYNVQALFWPRAYVYIDGVLQADDDLPVQLKRAVFEAAKVLAGGEDIDAPLERGNRVRTKTETVGPISQRVAYFGDAPSTNTYPAVDRYISVLLSSSGVVKSVVRG